MITITPTQAGFVMQGACVVGVSLMIIFVSDVESVGQLSGRTCAILQRTASGVPKRC